MTKEDNENVKTLLNVGSVVMIILILMLSKRSLSYHWKMLCT